MRIDEQNRILIPFVDVVPAVLKMDAYSWARRKGTIQTTQRGGRGRFVDIIYDTLPDRYKSKIVSVLGDPREILGITGSGENIKGKKVPFGELTPAEFAVCNSRYNIVKQYRTYADQRSSEIGIKAAKDEFVTLMKEGYVCKDEVRIVGMVSFATIERWNKELRDGGDIMDVLAPVRAKKQGHQLTPQQKNVLIECYCKDSKPNYAQAYRLACVVFAAHNPGEEMVSEITASRFLKGFELTHAAVVRARREGFKVAKDTQLPYLQRDPSQIKFGDCWVADGKVLNFMIAHPDHGRPCRATMIGWQDFATGILLGFEIMVTENTLCTVSSFRNAAITAGEMAGIDGALMPRSVYMDNGRAFKNKFLNGNKDVNLETEVGGLFERLKPYGLELVLYAKPYNARSKTIERTWQSFDDCEQLIVSYIGKSISDKPASLQRNEIIHRLEREKALAKNGLPTIWGAYMIMQWSVDRYNNTIGEGKYLNGYTPNALALEHITKIDFTNRMIPSKGLDYMLMHSKTLKLGRNGFAINGISYYNSIFANIEKCGVSTEYIVKYSLLDNKRVLVYHENGEFMCEARQFWGSNIHPVAALGSTSDMENMKMANVKLGALEKSVKKAAFSTGTTNTALALSEVYETGVSVARLLPPTEQPVQIEESAPALALWSQE